MPSKTSLPPVLQSRRLRGKTWSKQKGPGQCSKGKKNKGTFVQNRGTTVLICRHLCSLSEPSRSSLSCLCDDAQGALTAGVWGRQVPSCTPLPQDTVNHVHMLLARESRHRRRKAQIMFLDDRPSLLYEKLFILLSRIKTIFIGIQHGFVMCHLGYSELHSLKFPFKCVSG